MQLWSKNIRHTLNTNCRCIKKKAHWRRVGLGLVTGLCILAVVVWFGRHATDEIKVMEAWIAGHGVGGRVVFVGMVILFTSIFVPDTVLAVAAGALFGLFWGTILITIGCIATAAVNFLAARTMLRPRIEATLKQHPKMRVIQGAANHEGLRLLLLLRLSPLSPVSVSYVMGASGVRFWTFMIATIGLIPSLFVEVYFGYMANHATKVAGNASEHSTLHTVMVVVGFAVCIALVIFITRIATKALADAEATTDTPALE